jgi:AraC-like DNA-binding protein
MLQVEDMWRSTIDGEQVSTQASHLLAVERVIQAMREHLHEPLSLEDMASIACLSPYYFSRVFHNIIGAPPGEFLAALRLDAAKRLLLTTSLSVTDICFEVGYTGLGSFTTRFTQSVGLPPRLLRHQAWNTAIPSLEPRCSLDMTSSSSLCQGGLRGQIRAESSFRGFIFAGLFPRAIPQGRPVRCTLLSQPGPYHIDLIPDGRYYLMVAAFPVTTDPQVFLLPNERLLVGIQGPLMICNGSVPEPVDVVLRPLCPTDPPIIVALPYI